MKHYIDKDALVAEIENVKATQFKEETATDVYARMALDMVNDSLDELETEDIIEKIANEIIRLQDETKDKNGNYRSSYHEGIYDGLTKIELFIDTL